MPIKNNALFSRMHNSSIAIWNFPFPIDRTQRLMVWEEAINLAIEVILKFTFIEQQSEKFRYFHHTHKIQYICCQTELSSSSVAMSSTIRFWNGVWLFGLHHNFHGIKTLCKGCFYFRNKNFICWFSRKQRNQFNLKIKIKPDPSNILYSNRDMNKKFDILYSETFWKI